MTKHKKKFLKILKKYFKGCPDDTIHEILLKLVLQEGHHPYDKDIEVIEKMYVNIKKQAIPCKNCGESKPEA